MAGIQKVTLDRLREGFVDLGKVATEQEREGAKIIREMLVAILIANKETAMDQPFLKALLSLSIDLEKGSDKRKKLLLDWRVPTEEVDRLIGTLESFTNRTQKNVSGISKSALMPLNFWTHSGPIFEGFCEALATL